MAGADDVSNPAIFDLEQVSAGLKSIPGYVKTDEDGDMLFEFATTDSFTYKRFCWIYLNNPQRIRIQCGLSKVSFATNLQEEFNGYNASNKLGIEAAYTKGMKVRLNKYIKASQLPNPVINSDKVCEAVNKALTAYGPEWRILAPRLGLKNRYYSPDKYEITKLLASVPAKDYYDNFIYINYIYYLGNHDRIEGVSK